MMDALATLIVPVIYVLSLLFVPNGIWKLGAPLIRSEQTVAAMELIQSEEIEKISVGLVDRIRKIKNSEIDGAYQLQKIQNSIQYTIGRHDWYEEQRSAIINKLLTFSGLAFTALALYVGEHEGDIPFESKLVIAGVGSTLVLSLLYSVHLYNSELDQDRPYRLVSDIRHWYFRYSLPERVKHYSERLDFNAMANDVLAERRRFVDRALAVTDLEESLREDLEQLFILHVLVKHKSESLQKLRWNFYSLIMLLSVTALWYFVYFSLFNNE